MCSEVYHERLDTGSDTVIHSVQTETQFLQKLPIVSARKYRNIGQQQESQQQTSSLYS